MSLGFNVFDIASNAQSIINVLGPVGFVIGLSISFYITSKIATLFGFGIKDIKGMYKGYMGRRRGF